MPPARCAQSSARYHLPVLIRPVTKIKRKAAPASSTASQTGHSTHTQDHAIRPRAFKAL